MEWKLLRLFYSNELNFIILKSLVLNIETLEKLSLNNDKPLKSQPSLVFLQTG